ncbi:MAG: PLxRFG domain-containing protein [Dechloromonas sp.]|nr:MAG: PLxRFG domain-containing protein [Dechloromonas sp.]
MERVETALGVGPTAADLPPHDIRTISTGDGYEANITEGEYKGLHAVGFTHTDARRDLLERIQARESLKPRQATEAAGVSGAAAPTTAEIKAAAKEADQHATQAQKVAGNYRMGHITWRGIDITIETAKGDERAGFAGDMPPVKDGHVRLFRGQSKRTKKLPEWIEQGLAQSGAKDAQGRWFTPSLAIAMWYVRDAGAEGRLVYVDVPRSVYDASRVSDNEAAIRFSRDPENENLIPREWSDRATTTPAEPWSVTMPAHYGYIKRTTGADGDHLDVYMGDHPDSDMVVVIDQVDAKTGDFDEHKVILGTRSRKEAMDLYAAGFSDGKGGDRIGGVLVMNVQSFQMALKDGSLWNGPMANAEVVGRPTPAPAPDRSPPARAKDDTRLRDWTGVIIDGHDDTTSEDGRNSPTKNAFMRDATGYAKRVAAALRDAGFMPAKDRKGKELKPVRWNASGIATSGDVSMSLMGPDGVGIYMLITQSALTGTRGGLTVKTNTTTDADPYGSRSMNEYPGASLTVDEMVAHMLKRVSREVEAGKARRMPTDINPMSAAAAENEAAPVGPRVFINRLTTADLLKDEGFKEGAEGRLFLKMRNEEKKTTHTYIVREFTDGRQDGTKRTALQRLVQHDQHGGLPSKWLLEDAKGPDPILKAIEEDTDGGKGWVQVKSETPAKAPTLPPNFFQTYAKPMTKAEAEGTDHKPGTIKAIITRQSPFSAIDGYGATVDDALADAARKARAEIAKEAKKKPLGLEDVQPTDQRLTGEVKGYRVGDLVEVTGRTLGASRITDLFRRPTLAGDGTFARVVENETDKALIVHINDLGDVIERAEAATEAAENAQNGQSGQNEQKPALSSLTQAEQDRAALLRARIAERMRTQLNAGIDPELLKDAVELVGLYVKAGLRRFRVMLDQVAADMGLTARDIEPWARAAYNQARDDMELDGQDVGDMDDSKAVLAEVKALRAEASQKPAESPILENEGGTEAADVDRADAGGDREGAEDGPGVATQEPAGPRDRGEGEPETGARDDGAERAPGRAKRREVDAGDDLFGGALRNDSGRARNFVIEPGGLNPKAGEKTRARESVAAIRTLKDMGGRVRPTLEEQTVLSRYGGAGTLAGALPRSDGSIKFPDIAADLDALLTDDEKRTLSRTSQYAFYTAEPALRAMWSLAQRLGFKGGRVFEPGMGVGGFIGTVPAQIRHATDYRGIELDHVTAAIAKRLYPDSQIDSGDFIQTKLPLDYYDLAIGNPPFAGIKVQADPDYPQGFFLHDYFFAKTLDAVRPGGILMFVTSAGTMNKQDTAARDYLADRADLLGAIRLPNTAFKENGTEVTTDIIVLRKRLDGEKEADPSWRRSEVIDVPDPDGGTGKAAVNRYFIDHPEMILGEQGLYDTLTATNRIGVRPRPGSDLATDLAEAITRFASGVMSEAPASIRMDARDTATTERKAGSYYMKDGDLYQFDGAAGVKIERRTRATPSGMSKGDYETVLDLLPIRDALRDVYAADVDGKDGTDARARLNATYDAFVKKRGPIGLQVRSYRRPSIVEQETARQRALEDARAAGLDFDEGSFDPSPLFEAGAKLSDIARAREEARKEPGYREGDFNPEDMPDKVVISHPNIDPFADDPESFRLRAIEKYDSETDTASKSRVFTENAVTISVQPKISSPEDALLYVLSEDGRVDLNKIADLSSSTPDTVRQELGEKIFHDPASGEWQTAAKYLSGNVRIKLDEARVAARARPELQINVQALEAVQPTPIPAADIRVPIGAHWFPSEIYSQFAKSLGLRLEATFRPSLGIWTVDGSNGDQAAKNDWGTEDIPFGDMMQRIMNNKPLKVTRTVKEADGSTHTFTDETATQAANDKANELRSRFSQWFWEDQDRATDMEARYNATFNAEVAPAYDGGYLTTPGIHADWSWRPHQTAAIARFLQSGNTYLAHTVGAGKTSEMIGIAMEGRRLGIVKKPMIVVPNHMLVQFATEFYQQYPLANILVADERRFHTSRRKQFIADVALGNWDAIVITHSAFGLIPVSDAAKAAAVSDMLNDIRDVMGDATASGDRGTDMATDRAILGALESVAATLGVDTSDLKEKGVSTRKKIERLLEAAEQRIARQTSNRGKDQVFDFDELGIDTLMVDEAHLFRKLSFATTNGAIKGIDPAGSQASMDLYIKTRALEAVNPGRSLIFASGTPITNTMAELYTISRYLQPQALADRGMTAFDAWAGSFGQVDTALEQTPDGGYKEVSRFAKFVNTPELSLMVRQVMDVVSGPDLEKYVTRPKLKRGQRTHVVVEPSQEVLAYRDLLSERMKAIENRKGPVQKGDDILLSVIHDGRLSAIDMRLVDPSATGRGSKLERMIQNVYRTWKEGANAPLHGVKREGGYTDEPVMRAPSTQIVFATLGINPSKHNPDFSVHRFIKAELVRMGVPASDIILQEDLKTHALKQRAFGDMNEGRRRILVGSKTLFTGVNAQRRVAAIHNLDPLWFPADDEQRNGRGIRQGNMNPEIEIFDYSTKGTYDATMWQMMARKASFIEAFFRGDPNMREMEDLGEASAYEQAKALSTKDPRVLVLTELKADRDKLQRRSEAVRRQKSQLASEIRYQEMRILSLRADKLVWVEAAQKVVDLSGDKFAITIDGQVHTKRTEAGNALFSIAEAAVGEEKRVERRKVGSISGFPILLSTFKADNSAAFEVEAFEDAMKDIGWSADPVGLMRRMEGAVAAIAESAPTIDVYIRRAESMKSDAEEALSRVKPFSEHDELDGLRKKINDLEAELLSETKAQKPPAAEEEGDKEMADLRGWTETEADPEISDESLAAIADAANKELAAHGLAGVVTVDAVRSLVSAATGAPVQGLWQPRMKAIRVRADAAAGTIGTLHHEIIHVLRSASVWRRQGGVITDREWRALIVEVARQPGLAERVRAMYPNLGPAALAEEQVAELYRTWRMKEEAVSSSSRRSILAKIRAILEAVANGLRGQGFLTAESVMRQIASGEVARRGQGRGADGRFISEAERFMASLPDFGFARTGGDVEANERGIVGHFLTNAMSGKNGVNLLALVPGRALFNELGRHIPSAQAYLRAKDAMDALRNKWQEKTDDVAQAWRKLIAQDGKANSVLMDLMHDATIAGVDPSRPFVPRADNLMKRAREEYSRFGEDAEAWALGMVRAEERKKAAHAELRTRFIGLPEAFRAMFVRVRNAYGELGDAFEQTVLDNARKAMNLGLKRAEQRYQDDLRAIDDDGLEGADREEAEERALERLEKAKKRAGWNSQARLAALRAKFESNRLDGPYFPLARFGNFFVTLRDADGKVISFSRFETEGDQSREAKRLEAEHPGGTIQTGVLSDVNSLRNQVDPNFVADVEDLIAEEVGDPRIMDMIWQRWLETLPDLSVRRSRLHRKGTPGYSGDAFRAFGRQMFHGSHQLARLKYAMDMQQNLMDARREAANAADPNRAGLVVTEMERRHGFTMNPVGSSWAQYAGTSAFIYYLAITPAAAMVNLTQTTIIGVPMLAAAFKDGGIPKAASEITKATRDFIGGRGHAQSSANLSDDERAAMREAYDRGVVDKTQAHDLAGVAETGVEYNATWQKWMAKIAWLFHHAERMNREVTFLAGYRMGRAAGLDHEAAISKAADVTWKSHFDYQNTSRPRLMQNDYMKVLLTYRNYVINMNYRLFRDLHQMLKGETAEDRREARAQLGGITLSMMLHAGIKGTWGYALITSLLGLFADDGEDDVEEALQSALVRLFGTQVAGMMLKGVPGHLTGVDMTKRIGMPELWLRSSDRALEGEAAYSYWLSEMVGPVPGIAENAFRGAAKISDGDIFKGIEAAMPKAIRDLMKAYRYATDGATTSSGLPLVDNVGLVDAMKQALGFTPARIAEAYEANSRLINRENRIESERSKIVNAAMREVMTGELTDAMLAKVQAFNEANPDYPITGDAIRRAVSGRASAERDTVGGIRLNRRLDARLRGEAAPLIYQ